MKPLLLLLLTFSFISPAIAKMSSTLEVSNVQSILIEEGQITIVGDAVFMSRMVTTNERKDSNLIQGLPSATYTAKGFGVRFVITPYQLNFNGKIPNEDKEKWKQIEDNFKLTWSENLKNAKTFKKGDQIKISITAEEVTLTYGQLSSVKGNGRIHAKAESQ